MGGKQMKLEAKKVTFSYPGRKKIPVLEQVDFQLASGERIGLKAPSGTGKTTLCRLLAGYEMPDQGAVLLDGKALKTYKGVCPVQMVWQHPDLAVDPLQRLGSTMQETGGLEDRMKKALYIQDDWLERFPSELSGGELQRFCLARALHPETRILLCDEISAMLDPVSQAQIWQFLLDEAKRRALGLLVISHDERLLVRVCEKIVEWTPLAGDKMTEIRKGKSKEK